MNAFGRRVPACGRGLAALVLALSMLPAAPAYAYDAVPPAEAEKTEVVYASLSGTGEVLGAYVVNRFDVATPGLIIDFGDYEYGKSLTSGEDISFEDGTVMVDVAEAGTFSYQGNTGAIALPWKISLAYELDGRPVRPDELAGASGRLTVRGVTSKDPAVNSVFFDSFMLQATFTLKGGTCRNVVSDGATVAQSGSDQTVAFTVLPARDGDFSLSADVSDFEMPGVQIVALPYTSPIEMPDTSGMTDGLEELADGAGQLAKGASSLASGADDLASGADELADGMKSVGDGLDQIGSTGEGLASGASAMAEAVSTQAAALAQMAQAAEAQAASTGDPQMREFAAALAQMSAGMEALDSQYGQFQDGLDRYTAGTSALAGSFGRLESGTARLASGAASLASGADELASGARSMERETAKLPARMQSEIDRMTADFDFAEFVPTSFMSPKNANVTSVQFVMTTEAIEKPEDEKPEEEPAKEETVIDRFLALFGL